MFASWDIQEQNVSLVTSMQICGTITMEEYKEINVVNARTTKDILRVF